MAVYGQVVFDILVRTNVYRPVFPVNVLILEYFDNKTNTNDKMYLAKKKKYDFKRKKIGIIANRNLLAAQNTERPTLLLIYNFPSLLRKPHCGTCTIHLNFQIEYPLFHAGQAELKRPFPPI